ncbi:RNase H domain-containing protein [Trichonephila clavipes]|nr:RNase H domain-containing protein [Trichonephila clavipes]
MHAQNVFQVRRPPIVTLSLSLLPPGVSRAPRSTCPRTGPMLSLWRLHAPLVPEPAFYIYSVPSNISAQQIPIQIQQIRELEILAIKIDVRNISFYIVNIYAPRGFNIMIIKSFLESLMAPMILLGDFNLPRPMWGSDHISRYSNEFVEWITDSNLVLLNTTVPTYRSSAGAASLIDLTICSSSMSGYCNSYVLECSFESDHSPIITELSLNSNKRIFKKVNWQAVMNQTHFILINPEVNSEKLSDKISQVITNRELNNRFITHPQLQADMIADYFASKNAYHEPLPLDFLYDKNNLLNKPFHILELHSAIKNSKNTTPGADHVTAVFFKNLDQGQRDAILRYFQKLFDNAIVPDSWKHAIILPIPKPCKDKTKISSNRPIALTFVLAAVAEWYRYRTVACLVTNSSPVPLKPRRVETLVICQALDDLVEFNVNLLVLSDSLSVLSALQNFWIKSHKVIHRLANKIYLLSNYVNQLILLWTPGHSKIVWNEQADNLARSVTESYVYIDWIASEDIHKNILRNRIKKINETFYSRKYFEKLGNILTIDIISKWTENRREEILSTRIFSKMIITPGLLHRFNLQDNAICITCNCINDLDHIILNCIRYTRHRNNLWSTLRIDSHSTITFRDVLERALNNK